MEWLDQLPKKVERFENPPKKVERFDYPPKKVEKVDQPSKKVEYPFYSSPSRYFMYMLPLNFP